MKRDKPSQQRRDPDGEKRSDGGTEAASPGAPEAAENLALGEWTERKRAARRTFPGPSMLDVALRVAMDRSPYADLIAHAKESLDKEICGVLVGETCEDDEGPFVYIRAIIRGDAAAQASTHVTYTQETWTAIHKTMEERYRKLQIVGWYHSHPGYGVEFSEMDRFIQTNFFSGRTQVGLVIDPLGGDVGIYVNAEGGLQTIGQFWVDGREQRCKRSGDSSTTAVAAGAGSVDLQQRLEAVENRLNQALRALDDTRTQTYRVVLSMGMVICLAVVMLVGYSVYNSYFRAMTPPEVRNYARIPVKLGDKVLLLNVAVVSWEVPPELLPAPSQPDQPSDKGSSGSTSAPEAPKQGDQTSSQPGSGGSGNPTSPDGGSAQKQETK
jgi:proteasome lid subunit RPN8/RPN11